MLQDKLPGPGAFSGSQRLFKDVVKSISDTEIADLYRPKGSGPCDRAVSLYQFYLAAALAIKPLAERDKSNPKQKPEKE